MSDVRRFAVRFDGWFRPLAMVFGPRPKHSYAEVTGDDIEIHMGMVFNVRFPADTIRTATVDTGRVRAWGVHGGDGAYLLNGSSKGLVRITLAHAARGRLYASDIDVTLLRVSLRDPQGFLAALPKRSGFG